MRELLAGGGETERGAANSGAVGTGTDQARIRAADRIQECSDYEKKIEYIAMIANEWTG